MYFFGPKAAKGRSKPKVKVPLTFFGGRLNENFDFMDSREGRGVFQCNQPNLIFDSSGREVKKNQRYFDFGF